MTKRIRTVMIILSVILLCALVGGMGSTLAIWTTSGTGLDNNTVAPATDSPQDWNVWAKYFDGIVVNNNTHTAAITAFHTDDYGLNLETVIIPTDIDIEIDGAKIKHSVVEIRSQIFKDATLKSLATTIYIPPTVTHINSMAFANLPNLTKVVFGVNDGENEDCIIDDYAFMMCANLATVITNGRVLKSASGENIDETINVFAGCAQNLSIMQSV